MAPNHARSTVCGPKADGMGAGWSGGLRRAANAAASTTDTPPTLVRQFARLLPLPHWASHRRVALRGVGRGSGFWGYGDRRADCSDRASADGCRTRHPCADPRTSPRPMATAARQAAKSVGGRRPFACMGRILVSECRCHRSGTRRHRVRTATGILNGSIWRGHQRLTPTGPIVGESRRICPACRRSTGPHWAWGVVPMDRPDRDDVRPQS